jgi:hypothetical protein
VVLLAMVDEKNEPVLDQEKVLDLESQWVAVQDILHDAMRNYGSPLDSEGVWCFDNIDGGAVRIYLDLAEIAEVNGGSNGTLGIEE